MRPPFANTRGATDSHCEEGQCPGPKQMAFNFSCPHCSGTVSALTSSVGKMVKCPHCSRLIEVRAAPLVDNRPSEAMTQYPIGDGRKKSAQKFVAALGVPVIGGIIIHILSGRSPRIASITAYLEGVVLIYAIFLLLLLVFFRLRLKDCAMMAAVPAGILVLPALILIAIALYALLILVGCTAWLVLTITGKEEWGTGSLLDIFTLHWWKSKGWKPPQKPVGHS